jgi:ubiquinone/menaquinone biosynthesis C-methylase UbiE
MNKRMNMISMALNQFVRSGTLVLCLVIVMGWLKPVAAQESPRTNDKATAKVAKEPKGLTKYLGRRIASPMGYQHMDWLSRPERIQEENPQEMLTQLELHDGMVVCDLGSGDGYHTLQMAPKVGPTGKVIAVDIQPQMLQELSRRLVDRKIENVDTILGDLWDPKLAESSIDLVLMVDVYHEFSHPVQMLAAIRKALKPDGLIALVEFRAEDPTVLIRPEHKMTKVQILKEYKANGFKVAKEYDRLPWQHLMFMKPDENWTNPADKTEPKSDE